MSLEFEIISSDLAKDMKSFMLPYILDGDSDDYTYFAAVDGKRFVGLVVADTTVVAPRILSIGISAEYQNQGIGTDLLDFAVNNIISSYDEDEMSIPNSISAWVAGEGDEYEALKRVFEKNSFLPEDEGKGFLATVDILSDSEILISGKMAAKVNSLKDKGELVPLKNINSNMLNVFSNFLIQNELYDAIRREDLDENLTYFGVKDGEICSCILFAKEENNRIRNNFLYQNNKKTSRDMLLYLLAVSAFEAIKCLKPSTELIFWIDQAVTEKLITKLLPGAAVNYTAARYRLTFGDYQNIRAERFESDQMEFVENKNLSCGDCIYCTKDVLRCKIYSQKPSKVLDGEACPDHKTFEE